ncbi:MAG: hypothetical protein ACT4QD_21200 [Acidobacteriota bacterium]
MRRVRSWVLAACVLAVVDERAAPLSGPTTLQMRPVVVAAAHTQGATTAWGVIARATGALCGSPGAPGCSTPSHTAAGLLITAQAVEPPTNLTASVNGDTVSLLWTGVSPATSYIIEVGSFRTGANLAVFDTQSTATSLVVTGVPPMNYWVRVRARRGSDTSDRSNDVHVRVRGGHCLVDRVYSPIDWRPSGGGSTVTLAWEELTFGCPPTEYLIQAGSTSLATDVANYRTGSAATAYTANNVPPGTYYVRVFAANDVGESLSATERIVGTGACVYGVRPTSLFISASGLNGFIAIQTDPSCPWTVTTDAWWLVTPSGGPVTLNGAGDFSTNIYAPVNNGFNRNATIRVRWPGGGGDVPVMQRGLSSPF